MPRTLQKVPMSEMGTTTTGISVARQALQERIDDEDDQYEGDQQSLNTSFRTR